MAYDNSNNFNLAYSKIISDCSSVSEDVALRWLEQNKLLTHDDLINYGFVKEAAE